MLSAADGTHLQPSPDNRLETTGYRLTDKCDVADARERERGRLPLLERTSTEQSLTSVCFVREQQQQHPAAGVFTSVSISSLTPSKRRN